jgi:8-oxo-dGTP pyrophosphatase MutT (NUDIX family)
MKRALKGPDGQDKGSKSDESSGWLHWQTQCRDTLFECKVFAVEKLLAASNCGAKENGSFYILTCDPWVNVIAVTDKMQLVLVEQYRHGIEGLTLEIPGGIVDVTDSDPLAAAVRELKEETGYIAERWSFLGKNHPNPALQNNLCYTYLAEGVRLIEAPKFDGSGTEKINTRLVNLNDIGSLIRNGTISHALVITAFHFLTLERPELSIVRAS